MKLIPLFDCPEYRFQFRPLTPEATPAAWVWVADGFTTFWSDVHGVELGVEPGSSPRWAHEFYYRDQRQEVLPICPPEGLEQ